MTDQLPIATTPRMEGTKGGHVRVVRLPFLVRNRSYALGDLIRRMTSALGLHPCGGCQRRAASLNARVVLVGRGPTSGFFVGGTRPAPRPGCWFAGTSCYVFIQTLKFCCGDGTEYTERWGWCIGWWGAPPCRPR